VVTVAVSTPMSALRAVLKLAAIGAAAAATAPSRQSRARAALLAGLLGDSLALSSHYEYDAHVIAERVGSHTELSGPTSNSGPGWGRANYHPGKVAGDMTDAGDVAFMLLDYLASRPRGAPYDFDAFAAFWRAEIEERGYGSCNFQSVGREATSCPPGLRPGYLNGATRRTLDALRGLPSAPTGAARRAAAADVNCLFGATHIAPLLADAAYARDEAALVRDAVSTVFVSHRNRDPVAAADFLARAAFRLLDGAPLRAALDGAAAATGDAFISARLAEAAAKAAEAADAATPLAALGRFTDDAAITSLARLWDITGAATPIKVRARATERACARPSRSRSRPSPLPPSPSPLERRWARRAPRRARCPPRSTLRSATSPTSRPRSSRTQTAAATAARARWSSASSSARSTARPRSRRAGSPRTTRSRARSSCSPPSRRTPPPRPSFEVRFSKLCSFPRREEA
jgi:hypothetical protein